MFILEMVKGAELEEDEDDENVDIVGEKLPCTPWPT